MSFRTWRAAACAAAACAGVLGAVALVAPSARASEPGPRGADFIDVEISNVFAGREWGRVGAYPNGMAGCAISTTSHNVGTLPVDWYSPGSSGQPLDNRHPFIGQNLYRRRDGRLEQIGLAWMKHGFFSENLGCDDPGGDFLGVGCFDTYDVVSNQNRNYLGPRSEINPVTGYWEPCGSHFDTGNVGDPPGAGDCLRSHGSTGHDALQHRIRIADQDVLAADTPDDIIMEGFYVVADDIDVWNNWRHRPTNVVYSVALGRLNFTDIGTEIQTPAIMEWGDEQSTVSPNTEGEAVVALRVVDLGGGDYRYEYNVLNMTIDRAIDEFVVPVGAGVSISNAGFHAPVETEEPLYSMAVWSPTIDAGSITWAPPAPNGGAGESFPNTIRYGTMYTFWFEADTAPGAGAVELSPYKAGASPGYTAAIGVPCSLPEDINADGVVNTADLGFLLSQFGTSGPDGDLNGDLIVNTPDLGLLIARFGADCLPN